MAGTTRRCEHGANRYSYLLRMSSSLTLLPLKASCHLFHFTHNKVCVGVCVCGQRGSKANSATMVWITNAHGGAIKGLIFTETDAEMTVGSSPARSTLNIDVTESN